MLTPRTPLPYRTRVSAASLPGRRGAVPAIRLGNPVSRPRPTDEPDDFAARLAAARARNDPVDPVRMAGGAMGQGFRFAVEIVITTVVGSAIGWQLDHWLGTKPWLLLLFMLLGLAAGFLSLFRAVGAEQKLVDAAPTPPAAPPEPED